MPTPPAAVRGLLASARAAGSDVADGELLHRYVETGDPTAFEALVRRHAGLVWHVCRHALGHHQDAEDAFQATFLVLARKAGSVRRAGSVAAFLHGVALRVAMKCRRATRRTEAAADVPGREPEPATTAAFRELQVVLAEEVDRLPTRLRDPFILCVLEGAARADAALALGVNEGTLSTRLAAARVRLRERLARRGVLLAAAVAAFDLTRPAGAAPGELIRTAISGALGDAPPVVVALAGATVARTGVGKLLVATAVLLGVAGLGLGPVLRPEADPPRSGPSQPASTGPADRPVRRPAAPGGGPSARDGAVPARRSTPRGRCVPGRQDDRVRRVRPDHALGGRHRQDNRRADADRVRLPGFPPEPPRDGHVFELAFSPDGKWLYSAGTATADRDEGEFVAWDLTTRTYKYATSQLGGNAWKRSVAASPDGSVVAVGGDGGTLWLIDPATRKERAVAQNLGGVGGLSFAPGGRRLAAATGQGVVLFDPATGKELTRLPTGQGARRVAFAPDGKSVWVGRDGSFFDDKLPGTLSRWDADTGKELATYQADPGAFLALALSPDGKTLASGGERTGPCLWDTATGAKHDLDAGRKGLRPWVQSLAFDPVGKTLVAADTDGRVRVFDVAARKELHVYDEHAGGVLRAALSPDETRIATAGGDGTVRLWDVKTGRSIRAWPADDRRSVFGVEFTPDGRSVLTHGWDGTVRLWDAATGTEKRRYTGPGPQSRAALSPDGTVVAAAGEDHRPIILFDAATGRTLRECVGHTSFLTRLAFSADGGFLVSAADMHSEGAGKHFQDCTVRVWDAATGEQVRRYDAGRPRHAGISPDGRVAVASVTSIEEEAAGRRQATVRFWDVATGRELTDRRLDGGGTFAFSRDGRYLATADRDIRLREVATGRVVHTVATGLGEVYSLAFSRNGRRLISAHADGTVLAWDLTPPPPGTRPDRWWADLGSEDAGVAWRTATALVGRPDEAVALLRGKLRPVPKPETAVATAKLVADLDDPRFGVREAAGRELRRRAGAEFRYLLSARRATASAEVRERIEAALRGASPAWAAADSDAVQQLRAVAVLESVGTPEARQVLAALADGGPSAPLTREAAAAAKRLPSR